ncbi:AAA family ATPase [Pseudomonas sp. C27(2019)]|uniref:cellulose synthase operon protein YhjQ/BcsQ n=1 Tax=Pseudomonas sp. C27(2019) TaxID=2604941 RepID=UPI001243BA13|nr:cellulose synthase operon protein YhjQ/BcsQ [Pseudomonas sp. C27(2019)]QEY57671.1 AAA family ATPase [Pseudomonas sp. C27(2019)]
MQVTVVGLRGGVGATSIAAMLADALSLMGESVLLIDLNPSDLLRLYFNIP